jgi:hypothetical protein
MEQIFWGKNIFCPSSCLQEQEGTFSSCLGQVAVFTNNERYGPICCCLSSEWNLHGMTEMRRIRFLCRECFGTELELNAFSIVLHTCNTVATAQ